MILENSDKLNILHLVSSHRWTGVAEPVTDLAFHQKKLGHNVSIACLGGSSFERRIQERQLDFIDGFFFNRFPNPLQIIGDLKLLKKNLNEKKIDVIHTHLLHDHWLAGLVHNPKKKNIILVRTFHRHEPPRSDPFHKHLFLKKTNLKITISKATRELICQSLKIPEEEIEVIYGGVDIERFNPRNNGKEIREELKIPVDVPVIGLVARFRRDRGFQWLFEAIPLVLQNQPEVRFVFVGRGEMKRFIDENIRSLPYGKNIIRAGYRRADLPQAYASFDVGLFLGLGSEGTCRAILEAMASAKPIIGINFGPVPEIIQNGENGLLVTPQDPQDLARAILTLTKDKSLLNKLGQNARMLVEKRFTSQERAEKTIFAYQKMFQKF